VQTNGEEESLNQEKSQEAGGCMPASEAVYDI